MRGIQEVSITAVPGTCDKYFIVSADTHLKTGPGDQNKSEIGFSILDFSKDNQYYPGRKGRVFDEYNVSPTDYAQFPGLYDDNRFGNLSGSYGPNGRTTFQIWKENTSRFDNLHQVIFDSGSPTEPQTLFFRTANEYRYAPITASGIDMSSLLSTIYNSGADANLVMTGGIDVAKGTDNVIRLAGTASSAMSVNAGAPIPTLELYEVHFNGATATTTPISISINTNINNSSNNSGKVRGVTFSPNGRYLYFCQAFAPYIGYVDVLDPILTVHDLAADLNIQSSLADFGKGQIRSNRNPTGTGSAIYFPSSTGMGYLDGADNPTTATWHSAVPASPALNSPPTSAMASSSTVPYPVTQYLMDKQNYHDQQIQHLQQAMCCLSNERIPEANHPNAFAGLTTSANPWTPQNNPFMAPVLCVPTSGSSPTGYLYFDQTFTVQTGARLFVRDMEWRFAPTAKLIVEKGAFVQFDNCLLRGDVCGPSRWPGVELNGTPNVAQGASTFPPDQGRMVFNGSTLQDALVGVAIGKKNTWGAVLNTGGILNTNKSTFLNCRVGVNFYTYQNKLPNGSPTRNRSNFVRTTFTVDPDYIAPYDFSVHAQMWKVDGIEFLACTFENQRTTEHNSSQLGQGIRSLDAHFKVLTLCGDPGPTPPGMCQNVISTSFTGLDMGIRAATAATSRNFTVNQARFENNVCGVYANNVLNFEVHNSNFEVGSSKATSYDNADEDTWVGAHRGIYSYRSYGFLVDDNTLTANPSATTTQLEGIVTGYSYGHNDIVFRNHASNLNEAYVGEGTCVDLANRAITGLWYLCNTNTNNDNGIVSRRDISPGHALDPNQTIRTNQGSRQRVADNTFGQVSGQWDINNENYANNALSYWWTFPQTPYEPVHTTTGVSSDNHDANNNFLVRPSENCAARLLALTPLPPDPNPGPVELRAYWMNEAQTRKNAYGNTRYLYDQLIDGGSTDETVQEIQSTWPHEAWELRQNLLAKSPYLSTDVLVEMVKKNIMPPAMVAEICIANPEVTKQEGFLKWLQYESPCNMPQYLLNNIEASWETKTYRTTLESTMAFEHSEMTQALGLTLASYHADTLMEQVDSIRATWRVLRTTAARYAEILTYLQQDNFDSAYAVMDRLPMEFRLKEKEVSEKDRTKQYINIVQGYRGDGRTEAELKEHELNDLRNLATDSYDRPAEWAQNILCFGYGECRPPRSGGEGKETPKALRRPVEHPETATTVLSAYPNPAGAWTNLVYALKTEPDHAYLAIRDAAGKEVARIPVDRAEGQSVWDTRSVTAGTYTVELMNGGSSLGAIKLIVKP